MSGLCDSCCDVEVPNGSYSVGLSGLFQRECRADRGSLSHGRQSASPSGFRSRTPGPMIVGCHLPEHNRSLARASHRATVCLDPKKRVGKKCGAKIVTQKGMRGGGFDRDLASFCPSIFLPIFGSDDRVRPEAYWLTRVNTERRLELFGTSRGGRTGRGKSTPTRQMDHGS